MVIIVLEPEMLPRRTHLFAITASCLQGAGTTVHEAGTLQLSHATWPQL